MTTIDTHDDLDDVALCINTGTSSGSEIWTMHWDDGGTVGMGAPEQIMVSNSPHSHDRSIPDKADVEDARISKALRILKTKLRLTKR